MIKYICDKCGKEVGDITTVKLDIPNNLVKFCLIDLCSTCLDKLTTSRDEAQRKVDTEFLRKG